MDEDERPPICPRCGVTMVPAELSADDAHEGEWVCLGAATYVGPQGNGIAESQLFDASGPIGRSVQSLLIERG